MISCFLIDSNRPLILFLHFETESYRLYDDLSIAERAKVIALETAMEREMNSSGAKEAIDQFNNGLITLKELVNKLVEIELELSK